MGTSSPKIAIVLLGVAIGLESGHVTQDSQELCSKGVLQDNDPPNIDF
jgi:hypothetical protein